MTAIGCASRRKPVKKRAHLLVHHRVVRDAVVEVLLLRSGRQFAVEQQVADFQEVAVLGKLLDRIAAMRAGRPRRRRYR